MKRFSLFALPILGLFVFATSHAANVPVVSSKQVFVLADDSSTQTQNGSGNATTTPSQDNSGMSNDSSDQDDTGMTSDDDGDDSAMSNDDSQGNDSTDDNSDVDDD